MYEMGGFYQDIDRVYNVPIDEIISGEMRFVVPTNGNYDFMQDFILLSAGNRAFLANRYRSERRAIHLGATS